MAHVLPSIRAEREETATQMAHIEFTPQAIIVHITGADRLEVGRVTQDTWGRRTAGVDGIRNLAPAPNAAELDR